MGRATREAPNACWVSMQPGSACGLKGCPTSAAPRGLPSPPAERVAPAGTRPGRCAHAQHAGQAGAAPQGGWVARGWCARRGGHECRCIGQWSSQGGDTQPPAKRRHGTAGKVYARVLIVCVSCCSPIPRSGEILVRMMKMRSLTRQQRRQRRLLWQQLQGAPLRPTQPRLRRQLHQQWQQWRH